MSIKECRICYENNLEVTKKFISPCACTGTRKYVHSECLDLWRERKRGYITFIRCDECLYFYNIAKRHRQEKASLMLHLPKTLAEILGIFWLTIFLFVMGSAIYIMDTQFIIIKKNDDTVQTLYYVY